VVSLATLCCGGKSRHALPIPLYLQRWRNITC